MSEGLDQEFKAKKLNAPLTRVEQNQFSGVQGSWEIFSFPELEVQGQNDLYIALCHWIEGFCFIDFFFFLVLHLLFKTLRLSALEMLKGLQASFLALLMHKMLKERLQIWFFFFLLRISGRLLQLYTKRTKNPSLPSTPSSSLTGQPSHRWLLRHYGHLSWHLSVSSWRRDIRFPQFPRQNQGSVFLSSLDGVGKVAFVCKWWPGLVLSRLLKP